MNGMEEAKWHWAEGMKYALEGIKLLFILNGAAAISILTFIGNTKAGSALLVSAMICFASGAAMTVVVMMTAYLTQLFYGNASMKQGVSTSSWPAAVKMHYAAYVFIVVSILCFAAGAILAACGFLHIPCPDVPCPHHP
jgi:hypothetical protein